MKRIISAIMIFSFIFISTNIPVLAEPSVKSVVAIVITNNAKTGYDKGTTFDDEITTKITENSKSILPDSRYTILQASDLLKDKGITNSIMAERSDIITALAGTNADYFIALDLQPFIKSDRETFFSWRTDVTGTMCVKIIDIRNNKYMFNDKIVDTSSKQYSSSIKQVYMMSLDKLLAKSDIAITGALK